MPAHLEIRPELQTGVDNQVEEFEDHPLFRISPVGWFEHLVQEIEAIDQDMRLNPVKYEMEGASEEDFKVHKQDYINAVGLSIHKMLECWVDVAWETHALESGYEGDARIDLGEFRQALTRHKVRPELNIPFSSVADLSEDGQWIFSLLEDGLGSLTDLLILAKDEEFDFEAAVEELRIWKILDESESQWLKLKDISE